jgi:hypothetical protein
MAANREILMKFITGQAQKVREDVSRQGYKDDSPYRNNPSNTIYGTPEGTSITMEGVSTPLIGIDEFGNRQEMFPGQRYEYPGSQVTEVPMYQRAGTVRDSVAHQADKILKYEQLRGGPGGTPLPYYSNPQYMDMLMSRIYPEVQKIMPKASAMEIGEAMDFIFNAGWDKDNNKITKDPRAFALQEYYRQYDKSKLDADGKWSGRKNPAYSFDKEYANTIGKLSENERRLLMNKGRDWYYKNINNPAPGVPSSDYNDTWYGRIWNTNDYKPFDSNNPKFIPKKVNGGALLNKTIKCGNCGWEWKAADGGSDVMDCHKCGGKGLIKAQEAEQTIIEKNKEEGVEHFNNVRDWYNSYTKSPRYLENLKKSGYENPQAIIDERLANINTTKFKHDESRLGSYYRNNKIHYSPIKDQENFPGDEPDSSLAHEFGHSSIDTGKGIFDGFKAGYNKYDFEQLKNRNKNPKISRGEHENYADLKAIQYEAEKQGLYKAGYGEFTEEIFDKLKNSGHKERLLDNFSKEDIIWLGNNIAQNDNQPQLPIAQEGLQTGSTLEGLSDEERQRKIDENTAYQLENIKKVREEEKIKEEEAKRKAQEEHNAFIKKNFNSDAVEKRKNLFDKVVSENEYPSTSFHEEWMNSPQYEKLLRESTRENNSFDLYNDIRNRNLQELKGKKINTSEDSFKPGAIAYFSPEERTINYPFDRNELDTLGGNFSNDFNRSVAVHEKSHFIDNLFAEGQKKFRLNSRLLRKELKNREDDEVSAIPLKDVDLINSLKVPKTDDNKFKYDYFTEPTEVRARLNEVRDNLFNSGNKEFLNRELNEEDLKSLYNDIDLNTNQGFRDLNDYFGKEGTLKLLNSVSQNDNNIDNQMPVAKRGGTWFGNADMMSVSNKYDIGGTTVAEQYTQITGKPWSTAKAEGLTDGTAKQNLALIKRLKQEREPVVVVPPVTEPINVSDKAGHTKEMAQRVVQLAEERIKNNNYIDVPDDIKTIAFERGEGAFGCIGGVCTVLKDAGVMNTVDWSNTHFAENAKDYGFTANQGWGVKGIQNLEPGDVLMTSQDRNASGNYYPTHSQIYLGKTKTGQLRFFDNFWKSERTYYEDEIKERLDPKRKKTEQHATIYKVNPYDDSNPLGLTPEEKKNFDDKQEFIKKESTSKASYKWSISPTAKDYNDNTQRVMDKFFEFANDNDKINELVKKTGKSKEEIHDSLLNVFGELGAENNWTTSKGKGLGSRLENIAESIFTSLGGGKKLSVGPGQIKYSSIPKDLKQKFDIKSPNDLYNLDKVLPLMAAMDLKDKQVLENWGENNTLSQKLFGWTRPEIENGGGPGVTTGGFKASQLTSETGNSILDNGIGRYSPYLRNQYSSIDSGTTYEGGNDWIPFNEGTMPNFSPAIYNESGEDEMRVKYQRDPGSYPYKVEQNWRDNIKREIVLNKDGEIELNEIVIKGKKKKRE